MTDASPSRPGAPTPEPQQFIARLRRCLADGSFVQLSLARPHGTDPTLQKLLARRVVLRGEDHLSLVWRHQSRDITKNLPLADAVTLLATLVEDSFHHAHLVTRQHDIQLAWGKRGPWGLRVGKLAAVAAPSPQAEAHDQARQHALALDLPFLAELGVTDAQGRLVPAMARKWRQINKFVEVLGHALTQSTLATRDPVQPVRVLDFGAGKGYLTFAVQHHLRSIGRVPDVTGVEMRDDLTGPSNAAVARLGLQGLHFATGDVRSFADPAASGGAGLDVMIALHACDIATDVAMHRGVTGGAAVILCSPLLPQAAAPADAQPGAAAADAAPRHPHDPAGRDADRHAARDAAAKPRLRHPGVRVHLARAHRQEQDGIGGAPRPAVACRSTSRSAVPGGRAEGLLRRARALPGKSVRR